MTMNSNICKDDMNSWNMDEYDQRRNVWGGTLSAYINVSDFVKQPGTNVSCVISCCSLMSNCFCHLICQPWQQMPRSLIGTTLLRLFYVYEGEQKKSWNKRTALETKSNLLLLKCVISSTLFFLLWRSIFFSCNCVNEGQTVALNSTGLQIVLLKC